MDAGEVARRLLHLSGTIVPALYLFELLTWLQVQGFAVLITAVGLALEGIRLRVSPGWRLYRFLDRWFFNRLTREYEQSNLAGYALFLLGGTTVALVFPPRIAVPAFLMLTIADPISGLIGSGELRSVKRPLSLGVTLGLSLAITAWFVPPVVAVLGAATTTFADGAKPVVAGYVIDDNLTIPIGSAAVMWFGVHYLPAGLL